jgi:hypothetical protein
LVFEGFDGIVSEVESFKCPPQVNLTNFLVIIELELQTFLGGVWFEIMVLKPDTREIVKLRILW